MTEPCYELSFYLGPCPEEQAVELVEAIMDLPQFSVVGGGAVGLMKIEDEKSVGSSK